MATILQTTDTHVSTSPAYTLSPGDYFYQVAGISLTTTDGSLPAILATGSGTVDIHGTVFSPNVAIGGPLTAVIVASGADVTGGSTGLQTLNTSTQNHYAINGSLTGGTYGLNSSGSNMLYLHVGATGIVTGLDSNGINLNHDIVFASIDGSVSGVQGIGQSSTNGFFVLNMTAGAKATATSSYGISFANSGYLAINGQAAGTTGINSTTVQQVTITVGMSGSAAGSWGDGIAFMSQSATIAINGDVNGSFNGLRGAASLGTSSIAVGADGFVSGGYYGIYVDNNATVSVAGTVSGINSWGIQTGTYSEAGEIYVHAGGLVTGGGGSGGGAVRTRGTHVITNDGTISSTDGVGVLADGAGYLLNTGIISGSTVGILYTDTFSTSDVLTTVNTGTISGGPNPLIAVGPNFFAYDATGSIGTDRFINEGDIIGDVRLGQHSGSNFVNAGTLTGSVYLGAGGQVANSALGTVSGMMVGGTGNDAIVGGQNGGLLLGNAGNDMIYANPTQAAADNHATATLAGGTGTNALYGGGGFNVFVGGDTNGGYNQIWGGASGMSGLSLDFTNNTITFASLSPSQSVYVDLLNGHNAYINSGPNQSGTYVYEDSIINVPNVIGSSSGDVIIADNGIDRIQGNGGADALYAGTGPSSQDTFVYTSYADSNLNTGYDTIVGFKLGIDKIDLSALFTDGSHLAISTAGTSNTLYIEVTPGTFNPATDLALIVNATTNLGLTAVDFIF